MKIVLLGYMGSGKTSIGKRLARDLKLEFIDLDQAIEEAVGTSVPEIFSGKGELFFRKKEMEVLEEVLKTRKNIVLALGGGTPCYGNNMQLIKQSTPYSFYLKLSIGNLVQRLASKKAQRPLVTDIADNELPEFIGKHLFERGPFYAMANFTIDCNGKTVAEICGAIQENLL